MKILKNIIIASTVSIIGVLFFGQVEVGAWSDRIVSPSGDVKVDASKIKSGSVYVYAPAGEAVITGKLKGDLYCAAQSVRIDAEVSGSINCAGVNVSVKGEVGQGVRLLAQDVKLEGDVSGDMSIVATNLRMAESSSISGDLNGKVSSLDIDGSIGGGVIGSMGQININNKVGSLDVIARSISLGSSSLISNDVNYQVSGNSKVEIDKSKVEGSVTVHEKEGANTSPLRDYLSKVALLVAIILSVSVASLMFFSRAYGVIYAKSGPSISVILLIGFIVLFTVPAILLFLVLTAVGAPLAISIVVFWVALLMASIGYTVYVFGRSIAGVSPRLAPTWSYAVAAILLGVAISLPLVGAAAVFMSIIYGSGSLVHHIVTQQLRSDSSVDGVRKTKASQVAKKSKKKDK